MQRNLDQVFEVWARTQLQTWTIGLSTISVMMEQGVVIEFQHGCKILDRDEVADNVEKIVRNFEKYDSQAGMVLRVNYGAIESASPYLTTHQKARRLKMSIKKYQNKLDKAHDMVRTGLEMMYGFSFEHAGKKAC